MVKKFGSFTANDNLTFFSVDKGEIFWLSRCQRGRQNHRDKNFVWPVIPHFWRNYGGRFQCLQAKGKD